MFSDQHEVADIDDRGEEKAQNQRNFSDVDCVNQHHEASGDTQIPKLNRNDAAFEPLGDVPLNDETARKKQVGDQPKERPEGELARKIAPEIMQVMRQWPFIAFRSGNRKPPAI